MIKRTSSKIKGIRSKPMCIKMTQYDLQVLQKYSDSLGVSKSKFIKDLIHDYEVKNNKRKDK